LNIVGWGIGLTAVLFAVGVYFAARAAENRQIEATETRYPNVVVRRGQERVTMVDAQGNVTDITGTGRAQALTQEQRTFRTIITVQDAEPYAGTTLDVMDSHVLDVIGDRIFTVGPQREESLLVRISDATDQVVHVKSGQYINIVGTLRNMPSTDQRRSWGLTSSEEGLIGRYRVYLDATSIEVTPTSPETRPGG
jgi:hypothetical protein